MHLAYDLLWVRVSISVKYTDYMFISRKTCGSDLRWGAFRFNECFNSTSKLRNHCAFLVVAGVGSNHIHGYFF